MEMQSYLRKTRVAYKVTKITPERIVPRKSYALSESQKLAKSIAREINGLAPYEKKAVDLMKADEMKKAKKYLKIRLGSWARAEKKFEDLLTHYR